ncbi:MAG: hypothetical protein IPO49_15755 [Bacteroidetes bacterium]|nr:hypothetical protein [Bacteroidota bacterium]
MNMKFTRALSWVAAFLFLFLASEKSVAYLPTPDHVVVVVLENHAYQQIVGSPAAPYINGLFNDPKCALFTQSFGLSHPSQPNYIQLFSGSNQGVTDNNVPDLIPFSSLNLGASLIGAGRTFAGYSEDLPSVGATDSIFGLYARKHNPWVNWQGAVSNAVPSTCNQPFTAFPSNFASLPTVSFVVPNLANDMHNGTDPTRITTGDSWVQNQFDAYIQWAKTNNSLLILTFDEDDDVSSQHILTCIIGEHVIPGSYSNTINHYNVLRMIEDMYALPHAGAAATATTIDYCFSACAQLPTISASGPLSFCQGGSVTLTASAGASYLWSNGATTNSINVSTSGNFYVSITDGLGCTSTAAAVTTSVLNFSATATVFTESMGNVSGTTAISTHETANGFDNDSYIMSGTSDIRNTSASTTSNYPTASGGANIFITNTVGRNFTISGINTAGLSGMQLSFGILKNTTASNGSDFQVLVSTDGTNFTQVFFPVLPSGSGTAVWTYRTISSGIPSASNLSIQFKQTGTTTQYRLDDVVLTYPVSFPAITASGPTTFCQGSSVILSCTPAPAYTWSNGATTSSITVTNSGNFSVAVAGDNGCTATSNTIAVAVNFPPVISSFSPSSAISGEVITVLGSNFNGVSSVKLNGVFTLYSIVNSSQLTFTVPSGAGSGTISVTTSCGTVNSSGTLNVLQFSSLQVHLLIEGFYLGSGLMQEVISSAVCDTITVDLHNPNPPYNTVVSDTKPINTSGTGIFLFPSQFSGTSYYIGIRHRNSLETWSALPVFLNSASSTFDFATSIQQAYGANEVVLFDGNAALFSGDINQDGLVESADLGAIENAAQIFLSGYFPEDISGDNLVESTDYSFIENSTQQFIIGIHP